MCKKKYIKKLNALKLRQMRRGMLGRRYWVWMEDSHLTLWWEPISPALLTLVLSASSFRLQLLIDDQPVMNSQGLQDFSDYQQSLRLGGGHFEGCISNVFVQRWVPVSVGMAARGRVSHWSSSGVKFMRMRLSYHKLSKHCLCHKTQIKNKPTEKLHPASLCRSRFGT